MKLCIAKLEALWRCIVPTKFSLYGNQFSSCELKHEFPNKPLCGIGLMPVGSCASGSGLASACAPAGNNNIKYQISNNLAHQLI